MELYEYHIKKIFQKNGIPVLNGGVAYTPEEAFKVASGIDADAFYVKAQVFVPNRAKCFFKEKEAGKKTGVRLANSAKAVQKDAAQMLGNHLMSPNNPDGVEVKKIYIEERVQIASSYRLSIFIDFDCEKVFAEAQNLSDNKKEVVRQEINLSRGIPDTRALKMALSLTSSRLIARKIAKVLQSLYEIFVYYKAFKVEIDPLIVSPTNAICAVDGQIIFDPDASLRYKEINILIDREQETKNERNARLNNFRYMKQEGNIGCIVNGSGSGMATFDLLHIHGGRLACLLDLGSEPTKETMVNAFRAVLSEPNVEGIFVNILGANTRCDTIAEGLISAAKEVSIGMPIVVRISGTNEQIAGRLLFESGLPFLIKKEADDAVRSIIQSVQEIM